MRFVRDGVTGNTPLMFAVMENKIQMAERLMDLGCELSARNREGYNTLHMACMYSRDDTLKFLLSKGQVTRRPSLAQQNLPQQSKSLGKSIEYPVTNSEELVRLIPAFCLSTWLAIH